MSRALGHRPHPGFLLPALLLPTLLLIAGCGGGSQAPEPAREESPRPAATGPADNAADQEDGPSPFHEEARGLLREARIDEARLALENALLVDPMDSWARTVLAGLELHTDHPRQAAEHAVAALQERSRDCMLALTLAAARRRVDVAAGDTEVLSDVLSQNHCPPPAYAAAVERVARHEEEEVAGARLPEGGPEEEAARTLRLVSLTSGGPSLSMLADTFHVAYKGRLHGYPDRFAEIGPHHRIAARWFAADLVLLDVAMGPGASRGATNESLNADVDELLESWRTGRNRAEEYPAWDVAHWAGYEDVKGRFRLDVPDRWYANLFQGPDSTLYSFSPLELDRPAADPVRSGQVPAFDLVVRERREGDPPPWNEDRVYGLISQFSDFFIDAEYATEPWAELIGEEPGSLPGVLMARTFVSRDQIYRAAAAELTDGESMYRFAFAGPAEKFDDIEGDFWRMVRSLRPLQADEERAAADRAAPNEDGRDP